VDLLEKESRSPSFIGAKTHELLSQSISARKEIGLWAGPRADGGRCVFLEVADRGAAPPTPTGNGGGACSIGPPWPNPDPIQLEISWISPDSPAQNIVNVVVLDGQVSSTSGIRRIVLRSPAGETPMGERDGYYLGKLPLSAEMGKLPDAGGPYAVVGYDDAGHEVATIDLQKFVASASP
jgi:hypothetical protein